MYQGSLATRAEPASKEKTCPKCRRSLPIGAFDPNRARRDGLQCHCRRCRKRQRDLSKNGNGHAHGNGHSKGNGSSNHEDEEEEAEGGYIPIWKKKKVSREELTLQRDKYLSIINAASLALERIELRLGGNPAEDQAEEEAGTKEPPEIQGEIEAEDLEENLG